MKTTRNLIIIAILALLPTFGNAQTHLKKATTDFLEDKGLSKCFKSNTNVSEEEYYFKIYEFSIPKEKSKKLEEIINAFDKDNQESYSYFEQQKGNSTANYKVIAYGKDNKSNVYFGTNTKHNYRAMFFNGGQNYKSSNNYNRFNDTLDHQKRTVYALAWYEHGKNIDGTLYIIYGNNPQITPTNQTFKKLNQNIFSSLDGMSDVIDNSYTVVKDSIKTSDDFLSKFGNYRSLFNLYSNNEDIRLSTVNKILKICKNSGHLLDADEKKIVSNSIDDMVALSTDSYQKELLKLATKYLK